MRWMLVVFCLGLVSPVTAFTDLKQPEAARKPVTNHYHGTEVVDPYQWLEAMDDPGVRTWVLEQDAYARQFCKGAPARETLRARLKAVNQVAQVSGATLMGNRLFFAKYSPGRGMLGVWMQEGDAAPVQLPLPLGVGKEDVIKGFRPSPNGDFVAFWVGPAAGRWVRLRVWSVTKREVLPETLFGFNTRTSSVHWSTDNTTFFYERYRVPKSGGELTEGFVFEGIYQHRLGQGQAEDRRFGQAVAETDGYVTKAMGGERRFLVRIHRNDATRSLALIDARRPGKQFSPLFSVSATINYLGDWQGLLYFQTNHGSALGRIVAVDPQKPATKFWCEVVAPGQHALVGAALERDLLLLSYREHARPVLRLQRLSGEKTRVTLPHGGLLTINPGSFGDGVATLSVNSLIEPGSAYCLDLNSGKARLLASSDWVLKPEDFVMRQVFYPSKDGTKVPMFIVEKRGLPADQPAPTFLYGYGAGNWSAYPWFQPHIAVWLEMGGRYAMPGLRGGGEYGETWHLAGIKHGKQNGIDDFIAAAEFLIKQGFTRTDQLAVNGGSASGPLVAAAMVQRPELFGACLIEWPAIDMLRFKQYPGGNFWVWGHGDPDNASDFAMLRKWSPYHNLAERGCYPATMLLLGEKDETTAAAHGYKFQAALQRAQRCDKPVVTRLIWNGGHYQYGNDEKQTLDSWVDVLSFLQRTLNAAFQPISGKDT